MSILAFLTEATCGEACWHAREPICRCSCGGKNHGVLLVAGAAEPVRNAKIDGFRYELHGVDYRNKLFKAADAVNASYGCSRIDTSGTMRWHYTWSDTQAGAPARIKLATTAQRQKWKELAAFKDAPLYELVGLLWIRVDPPPVIYCTDDCSRCTQLRSAAHFKKVKAQQGGTND